LAMNETQAIALLCAPVGDSGSGAAPLTPARWADLCAQMKVAGIGGAADLASLEQEELEKRLALAAEDAFRIHQRFARADAIEAELDRLAQEGVWTLTVADADYPERLKRYLGRQAPPVLFGAGKPSLLNLGPGAQALAIVGSRSIDENGKDYARELAAACARQGIAVVSGAARGVDQIAMNAALGEGGVVIGVMADSLLPQSSRPDTREALDSGNLALITPYNPAVPFNAGLAMGRNKLIYALADWAVVVRCDPNKGGSWAGAIEAIKKGRVPVFARPDAEAGPGNAELLRRGALPFPDLPWDDLSQRLKDSATYLDSGFSSNNAAQEPIQGELF